MTWKRLEGLGGFHEAWAEGTFEGTPFALAKEMRGLVIRLSVTLPSGEREVHVFNLEPTLIAKVEEILETAQRPREENHER